MAVTRHGLEQDVKVGTSLLDMYCKCGDIASAEEHCGMRTWLALLFKMMSTS